MNNIKEILLYDISLLPDGWRLEDLLTCIENYKIIYYDGSKLKGISQIPRYINITENSNITIKDIDNDV